MAFKTLCLVLCLALYAMEAHGYRNYVAYRRVLNFFQADQACRQMGGQLAVIESAAELARATDAINAVIASGISYFFIGAMDYGYEGHFLWFPINKYAVYNNFASGDNLNGSENCVMMHAEANYKWYDVPCDYADVNGFVCSFEK
ncbi:pulmonary surfactant-associated protein D-like [Anopheles moucheti]|uniref:pulmonary surfactant-associated protein D-like n=1 Tax=Anopheles moucheti TaxID=186751 RepID=UPI0022F0C907|nr:pulmonary surfactant-associated protein D-like [Anopheles moucheti]